MAPCFEAAPEGERPAKRRRTEAAAGAGGADPRSLYYLHFEEELLEAAAQAVYTFPANSGDSEPGSTAGAPQHRRVIVIDAGILPEAVKQMHALLGRAAQ